MTTEPTPAEKLMCVDIAKHLKKSCYQLELVWLEDLQEWGIACYAKINGQVYVSANQLNFCTAKEHADMFKSAFSRALAEHDANTKAKK